MLPLVVFLKWSSSLKWFSSKHSHHIWLSWELTSARGSRQKGYYFNVSFKFSMCSFFKCTLGAIIIPIFGVVAVVVAATVNLLFKSGIWWLKLSPVRRALVVYLLLFVVIVTFTNCCFCSLCGEARKLGVKVDGREHQ